MLAEGLRSVAHLTLRAVEGRDLAVAEGCVRDPVGVHADAACIEGDVVLAVRTQRRLIVFRLTGFRRALARIEADQPGRHLQAILGVPNGPVLGGRVDAVAAAEDMRVLLGVEVDVGAVVALVVPLCAVWRDLAVAVGVDNTRAPALGLAHVLRLIPDLGVDETVDIRVTTEPQRVCRVVGEGQVMDAEAHRDVFDLRIGGIVDEDRRAVLARHRIVLRILVGAVVAVGGACAERVLDFHALFRARGDLASAG